MYNDIVQSMLSDAMAREPQTINNHWTNEEYNCLFRINKDTNQKKDSGMIYYPISQGIKAGMLLDFKGKTYLVLNLETQENDIYFRSDLIQTNMELSTFSNGKELVIPCYAGDLLTPNPAGGNSVSIVNGSIELLTEYSEVTQSIKIDSEFEAMGGVYKVGNKISKGGIEYLYVERDMDNTADIIYTLEINSLPTDSYAIDRTHQFIATAMRNGEVVINATVEWISNNKDIVTIDKTGAATFNKEGTGQITAKWIEHDNIVDSVSVEVTDPSQATKFSEITYVGNPELRVGGVAKTFTAKFYNADNVIDSTKIAVWSLDLPIELNNNVSIVSSTNTTVKLQIPMGDDSLIGYTFKLLLTDTNGEYNTELAIKTIPYF